MHIIKSKRLRSALYARNVVSSVIQDRLDAVHKARHVGKKSLFSVQNLDAFALVVAYYGTEYQLFHAKLSKFY